MGWALAKVDVEHTVYRLALSSGVLNFGAVKNFGGGLFLGWGVFAEWGVGSNGVDFGMTAFANLADLVAIQAL